MAVIFLLVLAVFANNSDRLYEDDAHERYYSSVTIRHVLRYSVYTEQPPGICSSDPDDFLLRYLLKFGNCTHHIRKI